MDNNFKFNSKFSGFTSNTSVGSPQSFQEWSLHMGNVAPGQALTLYNKYLVDWFKSSNANVTSTQTEKRLQYLSLLSQLQVFFSQEEVEQWYNNIDLTSEREIALAIPFFAKKLKEVVFYYLRLREKVQQSKIHYNTAGTNSGLSLQLTDEILYNFTSKNSSITLPSSLWQNVPALSAIHSDLNIQVVEYFDDQLYQDVDPTLPLSAITSLQTLSGAQNIFSEMGIDYSTLMWTFSAGLFQESLSSSSDLTAAYEKYGGENLVTSTPSTIVQAPITFSLSLNQGENTFYWPGYSLSHLSEEVESLEPTALSSLDWKTLGTAGDTLSTADKLFVTTEQGLSGFWLYRQTSRMAPSKITALFRQGDNTFRYPYFGFGLSGEGIPWTGPTFTYDNRYTFLSKDVKGAIDAQYWDPTPSLSGTTPLYLNSTTLAEQGSYPTKRYTTSDRIRVYQTIPALPIESTTIETASLGQYDEAWLYRFDNTEIPIISDSLTTVFWPYASLDTTVEFPPYYPAGSNLVGICDPVPLSGVDWGLAAAGLDADTSTKMYPVNNYNDTEDLFTKCFWLSGDPYLFSLSGYDVTGPSQKYFNLKVAAGEQARFVWEFEDISLDQVFPSLNHRADCPYILEGATPSQTNLCDCHQVYFTPFGSPLDTFESNNEWADYISIDNQSPKPFSVNAFKDYRTSDNFAWFKANNESGFGHGSWKKGNGLTHNFTLRKGGIYIYRRAASRTASAPFPALTIRSTIEGTSPRWVEAYKTDSGWVNIASSIPNLNAGDIFAVSHPSTRAFTLSSPITAVEAIRENRGSIWTMYDYVSIPISEYDPTQTSSFEDQSDSIAAVWPYQVTDSNNAQMPSVFISSLTAVSWTLITPTGEHIDQNNFSFSFMPTQTGIYALTAIGSGNSTTYKQTNIPNITAVNPLTRTPALTAYTTPTAGFLLNHSLKGWSYDSSKAVTGATGARPFWTAKTQSSSRNVGNTPPNVTFAEPDLPLSLPPLFPVGLSADQVFVYERLPSSSFPWSQNVTAIENVNNTFWSNITYDDSKISSLSSVIGYPEFYEYTAPTYEATNFSIEYRYNNKPSKIYYNAAAAFTSTLSVLPVTDTTCITMPSAIMYTFSNANRIWNNLANRFYPHISLVPSTEDLYVSVDKGGLFTPQYLGMSVYDSTNYTVMANTTSSSMSGIFPTPSFFVGGRGVTHNDQITPYIVTSDTNQQFKKSPLSQSGGKLLNKIYRKKQKFLPYQSKQESTTRDAVGLVTPTSRQDPWDGPTDSTWGDKVNKPVSHAGELDVDFWAQSQLLKTSGMHLYSWDVDVYNNQYGLYKENLSALSPYDQRGVFGEIWVKTNDKRVLPAVDALSGVFNTYKSTYLYDELVGSGIKNISVFFDTLYIETSSVCFFEKLEYDYPSNRISSIADNARFISLQLPPMPNISREFSLSASSISSVCVVGENWFFPVEKRVAVSLLSLSAHVAYPEIYIYDMNDLLMTKIFPSSTEDYTTISELSSLRFLEVDRPVLFYDVDKNEYQYTFSARDTLMNPTIISFTTNTKY